MSSPFDRHRGFGALFVSQLGAALNDNLFKNALLFWITARGESLFGLPPAAMLGVASALFIAPFFLFSGTAGQLADRFDKTRIARAVKLAEVAIMVVAAIGFVRGSLALLLCALFALGTHSAVLGPVKYGILPELVPSERLLAANARVEMGTFLAILAGTVLGGVLIGLPHGAWLVSAALIVCALLGFLASLAMPRLEAKEPSLRIAQNPLAPIVEILRITRARRDVLWAVLGISFFWLVGVVLLSYLPSYVHDTLRAPESVVTTLFALFCVGTAFGSLATERLSGKRIELGLVPAGALGMAVCLGDATLLHVAGPSASLAAFFARPGAVRLACDLFGVALFGGLFTVPLYTLLSARAPEAQRSRVVAGNNLLNALFMVLGSLGLAALTGAGASAAWVFGSLSVLCAVASVVGYGRLPEFVIRLLVSILSRVFYRLEVHGKDNVPSEGPAVLVLNHVSFNDWMVVAASVKRPVRFVMDHRINGLPVVRTFFRHGKTIAIAPAHEDEKLMEHAFAKIRAELADGQLVCIYPEGKITRTGIMNPFKNGVERILSETRVPVVPMAVHGLWGSIFSRKDGPALRKWPRRFRARLVLEIGSPLKPEVASAKVLEQHVAGLLARAAKE